MEQQDAIQAFANSSSTPYQQVHTAQILPPQLHHHAAGFSQRLVQVPTSSPYQNVQSFPGAPAMPIPFAYPPSHARPVQLLQTAEDTQLQQSFQLRPSDMSAQPQMQPSQQQDSNPMSGDPSKGAGNAGSLTNPPQLEEWRQKLFAADGMLTLTQNEFETYFPYVDNVYSHRSTQQYKRNPFVAQYWDCRLKGRPPGTKKTDDPNKKKRRRVARERDQCDVKIKIVEFFPGVVIQSGYDVAICATSEETHQSFGVERSAFAAVPSATSPAQTTPQVAEPGWTMPLISAGGASIPEASAAGQKIYTIQRVNGSATSGRVNIGRPSGHKHDLAYSDKIKKNSILRERTKEEEKRKRNEKTYHRKASGLAWETVKKHSQEHTLKFFGANWCPFVQRVWISLEQKGISYQYIEVDPYQKPQSLLDVNPRGLVPAIRHGDWACNESTVLMEYLEDIDSGYALLPSDAKGRAHSRLWADHVNRHVVPAFYHYLQAQDSEKQVKEATNLKNQLTTLINAAAQPGPFFLGAQMSFVDVQLAPWLLRFSRVLKPYRAWPDPEPESRWESWVNAIESNSAVKATTSDDALYVDSYERYAENRPDTSQVATAINEGRGLP